MLSFSSLPVLSIRIFGTEIIIFNYSFIYFHFYFYLVICSQKVLKVRLLLVQWVVVGEVGQLLGVVVAVACGGDDLALSHTMKMFMFPELAPVCLLLAVTAFPDT